MKTAFLLLLLVSHSAFAFDYNLEFEQTCSYSASKRSFPCEKSDQPTTQLQEIRGKWVGKNPGSSNVTDLELVRDDPYILVLQNPVYFSGVSLIHLMKKTGRFYWTETSYSEILKMDDTTVRVGRFKLDTK